MLAFIKGMKTISDIPETTYQATFISYTNRQHQLGARSIKKKKLKNGRPRRKKWIKNTRPVASISIPLPSAPRDP